MDAIPLEPARRTALRPWLLILLSAPVVVAGLIWLGYRWQTQRTQITRLNDTFIQRQNDVLAHDAMRVARALSDRLSLAARDARVLSAVPKTPAALKTFFEAVQPVGEKSAQGVQRAAPLYNRMAILFENDRMIYFQNGQLDAGVTSVRQCKAQQLCDRSTLEAARRIPVGKALVGRGLRWYTPEKGTASNQVENGTLTVAYRGENAIYALGIDFKTFFEIMRLPTFPYQQRGDLLVDYEEGHYIYVLDRETNLLAHPKHWHMLGIDPKTGEPVAPMRTDADAGTHPLNFGAYESGRLRPYFDRLFDRSFKGTGVDTFEAANLSGMTRVVSVMPVFLNADIFEQNGAFGYVGVGCALEHFQEPQQRLVPYY